MSHPIAHALADILECARAVIDRDERCPECSVRIHRTRADILLREAIQRHDRILASEWAAEAPTKPDLGRHKL